MAQIRKRGKSYQIDYFDPTGKRVRKSFRKRKDAEAELGKRVSLIAEGRYLDVKKDFKTTLGELIDKYIENYRHQSSFEIGKKYFIEDIREHFGTDTLLSNIRYLSLETYRNHLKQKLTRYGTIRSDASVNRVIACLSHLFSKSTEWEMVEQNPFSRGKSLIIKENNQRTRFLTEDEVTKLLDECPKYLRNIVECALNTGMRKGEILPLKWDQIRNGFIYLRETKTKESRQIPINNDLEAVFKQIRKEQHLRSDHIFLHEGKPMKTIRVAFKNALRRSGIMDFSFHDLRHTFASQVIMKGGSLKDVQELLGHKTMAMTLRYAHLTQEHKKAAVNLLNGLTTCHKTVTYPLSKANTNL